MSELPTSVWRLWGGWVLPGGWFLFTGSLLCSVSPGVSSSISLWQSSIRSSCRRPSLQCRMHLCPATRIFSTSSSIPILLLELWSLELMILHLSGVSSSVAEIRPFSAALCLYSSVWCCSSSSCLWIMRSLSERFTTTSTRNFMFPCGLMGFDLSLWVNSYPMMESFFSPRITFGC